MKKIVCLVVTVVFATPIVFAKGNHTMAGCGLGYVLFGNSDNSKIVQLFAATTNGTSGNQTFGITSGTSGCTEDGAVKFVKEAEVYAEVNLHSLRMEMAKGEGEFISTFASFLVKDPSKAPDMIRFLHDNYAALFPSSDVTTSEFLSALQTKLGERPDLLS